MVPTPHATLWLETGDIVLQAGDTLFKLERSVLRAESQFFADMLAVGHSGTYGEEGTEARPLAVVGVTEAAFTDTLRMAYDPDARCDQIAGYVGVLHVAHRFQFERVHAVARQRLGVDHASAADGPLLRLYAALSGRCGVDNCQWAFSAFEDLALARSRLFPEDISSLHENVQLALTTLRTAIRDKRLSMAHSAARKITCTSHWTAFGDVVDQDGGIAEGRRCLARLRNECMRCQRISNAVPGGNATREGVLRRAFSRGHELDMVMDAWREVLAGDYSSDELAAEIDDGTRGEVPDGGEKQGMEEAKGGPDSRDELQL